MGVELAPPAAQSPAGPVRSHPAYEGCACRERLPGLAALGIDGPGSPARGRRPTTLPSGRKDMDRIMEQKNIITNTAAGQTASVDPIQVTPDTVMEQLRSVRQLIPAVVPIPSAMLMRRGRMPHID